MKTFPEVVIVGGGVAGSSAALVLGRAGARTFDRRRCPSNTPSTGIGGLLGNDGTTPSDFYRRAASELAAYPSISRLSATVTGIYPSRHHDGFSNSTPARTSKPTASCWQSEALHLPDINGIGPCWGSSVFHCPFCHGWAHRDQPLAVLGDQAERALLLQRWTEDLTLITHGATFAGDERQLLATAGIRIVDGEIAAFRGEGRGLDSIELIGTAIAAAGILVSAPHQMRHPYSWRTWPGNNRHRTRRHRRLREDQRARHLGGWRPHTSAHAGRLRHRGRLQQRHRYHPTSSPANISSTRTGRHRR